ncbi:MAG: TVP38/TMEM64 family protein [Rubrivivax sp.]|nr:TVP38/TMEM64 family protein [Rubrivivax sp.]
MNRWELAFADWRRDAALRLAARPREDGSRFLAPRWPWGLALGLVLLALVLWAPAWSASLQQALRDLVTLGSGWRLHEPVLTALGFCTVFALLSAVSLPGCSVLALGAGAIFGPLWGAALITLSSAAGALVPFQLARGMGRERVRLRFAAAFERIDSGIQKAGIRYLLLLRLAPVLPYALVNPLMGLTPMPTWTFFWVSALGMSLGSAAYAWAGSGIGAWAYWPGPSAVVP